MAADIASVLISPDFHRDVIIKIYIFVFIMISALSAESLRETISLTLHDAAHGGVLVVC